MFIALAFLPGLIVLGVLVVMLLEQDGMGWPLGCALFGCLLAATSPYTCYWFTQNVLGDKTFNFGVIWLVYAQPILVPIGAGVGAIVGAVIGGRSSVDRDELPPTT